MDDAHLSVLFRKIGQKRDPITKIRAMEELAAVVYPPKEAGGISIAAGVGNNAAANSSAELRASKRQNDVGTRNQRH